MLVDESQMHLSIDNFFPYILYYNYIKIFILSLSFALNAVESTNVSSHVTSCCKEKLFDAGKCVSITSK